jgi:fumarylacetoacetase
VEVHLATKAMRAAGTPPTRLSAANARDVYWSFAQMIAHHTSNGCNLLPGDLIASGTISGSEEGTQGSLLEITQGGTLPLQLPNGERRTFLEDGDEITLRGFCHRPGLPRITLGECHGTIASAQVTTR